MAWWRIEMLMQGWSSSERSSPHSAPTPPSSPPTCHHRHPLRAARPSSQQKQSPPHTTQCHPLCQSPSPSIIPGLLLACQADGIKTPRRGGTQPPLAPRLDPSPVPRITHAAGVRRTNERTIRARVHPLSRERGDERDSSAARCSCLGQRVWKLDSAPLRLVYLDVMDHVAHYRVGRDGLARLGFGWGGGMPSREPFRRGTMGVSVPLDTLRAVVSGAAAICARGLQTPRYQRTEL